jgi:prepilin-type N-terminal cleavage/methylation domain-containing protein
MRIRGADRTDRGMTLLEVMMASSVLLICLTALATVLGGSITSSQVSKIRDEATNLANERIEIARSLAYDSLGLHYTNGLYGDPAGDIITPEVVGKFTVTTECTWIRTAAGRAAYKKLTVHVAWPAPLPGEVAVTTMVYGKSNIVTSGDLVVKLRYREDATPVSGASVAIVAADNSARSVVSDTAGEAFFGQLALGAATVNVTPPSNCIVDTSTITSITVAADSVTTAIVYLQHPAGATIHVSDTTSGTPLAGATVTVRRADGVVMPVMVTASDGDADFSLLYGTYSATIQKAGYPDATVPFTVSIANPNQVVPVSVSMLRGVGIRVRVFDVNGSALANGIVSIRKVGVDTVVQSGNAGSSGDISFTGLPADNYSATVDLTGYTSQVKTTTLHDGDSDTLSFYMTPVIAHGTMRITTLDKNGHAGSIRVIVSGTGYYQDALWSDAYGSLYLYNLVVGSYTVQCYTKPASVATVIVSSGQTAVVQVSQKK